MTKPKPKPATTTPAGKWPENTVTPIANGTAGGDYSGAELKPYAGRPGAMDAYTLPSRSGSRRFYPCGKVEAVA